MPLSGTKQVDGSPAKTFGDDTVCKRTKTYILLLHSCFSKPFKKLSAGSTC